MVSAITSLYNGKKYLESCINDLLNQTLYSKGLLEIIIVDSASTDNPEEIIIDYQKKYKNIHYIRTSERETLYKAWNRGILYSSGKYITNANVDDIHRSDALEIQYNFLENNPDIDLVYHNHYLSKIINKPFEYHLNERKITYPEFDNRTIYLFYPFCHQNMWRKSLHEKIGLFDETYSIAGDVDFAFKFSINGFKAKLLTDFLGVQISRDDQLVVNSKFPDELNKIYQIYFKPEHIFQLYKNLSVFNLDNNFEYNSLKDIFYRYLKYKLPGQSNFVINYYNAGLLLNDLYKFSKDDKLIEDYVNNLLEYALVQNVNDIINFIISKIDGNLRQVIIEKVIQWEKNSKLQ